MVADASIESGSGPAAPSTADEGLHEQARFRPLALLGRGSMGDVYSVHDSEIGVTVALKTLQNTAPEQIYRLKHEFRALAGLVHPNLVQLFELLIDDDLRCFTMELIEGRDFVAEVTSLPPELAAEARLERFLDLAIQLLCGLRAVHAAGRLHRDIKPSNLRVTPEGRVVLLDFDLAVAVGRDGQSVLPSAAAGTFAYMPPETLWGKPLAPAADLYSAGVVFYEALSNRLPYNSPVALGIRQAPPRIATVAPWVPTWLDELISGLLNSDPQRRPSVQEALNLLRSKQSTPASGDSFVAMRRELVGRETALSWLRTAYEQAPRDGARVVVISGSSGMGKSELVRHFLEGIEIKPNTIALHGRCHPHESVPFKALDAILDGLARFLTRLPQAEVALLLPPNMAALVRVFPVLGNVAGAGDLLQSEETVDAMELRRRAFMALRQLLARLAEQWRLVFWIDDIQWGDGDSASLLASLVRPPAAPPLLFLLSHRQGEDGGGILQALSDMDGQIEPLQRLEVGPLEYTVALRMAQRLCPPHLADSSVPETIVRESAGVPFLIHELARYAHHRGFHAAPETGIDFTNAIANRIAALPARAQRLVELIAVAGAPLERSVVLQASRDGEPGRAIVALLESECLVRSTPLGERLGVEPYHDRIRESVLVRLDSDQRRHGHGALATALESSGRALPDQLAEHFHGAGILGKAADYAFAAAGRAEEALAFLRAADFYRKAREWESRDDGWARQTLRGEAEARTNAAHFVEAAPLFLEARRFVQDRVEALDLQHRAVEQYLAGGHFDEGVSVLRELLARLGLKYPATQQGALLGVAGYLGLLAVRGFEPQAGPAATNPIEAVRIDTCFSVGKRMVNADASRGVYYSVVALVHALRCGDKLRAARGLCVVGGALAGTGGSRLAGLGWRMFAVAERLAEELGSAELRGTVSISRGQVLMLNARWQEALPHSTAGYQILSTQCRGLSFDTNIARGNIERVLEELGDIDTLEHHSRDLLQAAASTGARYAEVAAAQHLSMALLARDEVTQARALSQTAAVWSRQAFYMQHFYSVRQEAYCDVYAGNPWPSYRRVQEVWPLAERSNLLRIPLTRTDALSIRSRLAIACACSPETTSTSGELLAIAEKDAMRLQRDQRVDAQVHAALLQAGIASVRRQLDRAQEALERAAATADGAAMSLHAHVARYRLGQLRGGSAGRALMDEAAEAMRDRGVRAPAAWAQLYAPGAWDMRSKLPSPRHLLSLGDLS